ncbi:hypothetical protein F5882DRAFT_436953 [Hyaloscypha sp. PMI_1271]|nr:hypothetical protein F5882DRAFT_436953 [Hyaloscypha sp. PMI_1271]
MCHGPTRSPTSGEGLHSAEGAKLILEALFLKVFTINKEHNAGQEDVHLLEPEGKLAKGANALQNSVASDFWEALSQEANGIRKILEKFKSEDSPSQNSSALPGTRKEPYPNSENLLFSYSTSGTKLNTSQPLTKQMTNTLLSIYRHHGDSILKVLPWPTVIAGLRILMSRVERPRGSTVNGTADLTLLSSQSSWEDPGKLLNPDLPDTSIAIPNSNVYGFVDTENDRQTRMEGFHNGGLPWIA